MRKKKNMLRTGCPKRALRLTAFILVAATIVTAVMFGMNSTRANPDGVIVKFEEYRRPGINLKANQAITANGAGEYIPAASVTNAISSGGKTYTYADLWSDDNGVTIHAGPPPTFRNVVGDRVLSLYFIAPYTVTEYFRMEGYDSNTNPNADPTHSVLPERVNALRSGDKYNGRPIPDLTTEDTTTSPSTVYRWTYIGFRTINGGTMGALQYTYPNDPTIANVYANATYVYVYRPYNANAPVMEKTAHVIRGGVSLTGESGDSNWAVEVKKDDIIEYTFTVYPGGGVPVGSVIIDQLPAGLSYVAGSSSAPLVNDPPLLVGGRPELRWNYASLPGSHLVTFRVKVDSGTPRRYMNSARLQMPTSSITSVPTYHEVVTPETDPEKNAYINNNSVAQNGRQDHMEAVKGGDKIRYEYNVNKPPRATQPQFDIVFALDWSGSMQTAAMILPNLTGSDRPNVEDMNEIRLARIFAKKMMLEMCEYVFENYPDSRIAVLGMSTLSDIEGTVATGHTFGGNSDDPKFTYLQYNTPFVGKEQSDVIIENAFNGSVRYRSDDVATFMRAAVDKLAGPDAYNGPNVHDNPSGVYGGYTGDGTPPMGVPVGSLKEEDLPVEEKNINPRGSIRRVPVLVLMSDFQATEAVSTGGMDDYNTSGRQYWSEALAEQAERFSNPAEFPEGSVFFPVRFSSTSSVTFDAPAYNTLMQNYLAPGNLLNSATAANRVNWKPTFVKGIYDANRIGSTNTTTSTKAQQLAQVEALIAAEIGNLQLKFESAMPKPKTIVTDILPEGLNVFDAAGKRPGETGFDQTNLPGFTVALSDPRITYKITTNSAGRTVITYDLSTLPAGSYTMSVETTVDGITKQPPMEYINSDRSLGTDCTVEYADGIYDFNKTYHEWKPILTKHAYLNGDMSTPQDGTAARPVLLAENETFTYKLLLENLPGVPSVLTEPLPPGVTYISHATPTGIAAPTITGSAGSGITLKWNIPAALTAADRTKEILVNVRAPASVTGQTNLFNTASMTYTGILGTLESKTYHQVAPKATKNAYVNGAATPQNGTAASPATITNGDKLKYVINASRLYTPTPKAEYDIVFAVNWSNSMLSAMIDDGATTTLSAQEMVRDLVVDMAAQVFANYPNSRVSVVGVNSLYSHTNAGGYLNLQYNTAFVGSDDSSVISAALAAAPAYSYGDNAQLLRAAIDKLSNTATSYGGIGGVPSRTVATRGADNTRIPVIMMLSDFQMWETANDYTNLGTPAQDLQNYWSNYMNAQAVRFGGIANSILVPIRLDHAANKGLEQGRPELGMFSSVKWTNMMHQYVIGGRPNWNFAAVPYQMPADTAAALVKDVFGKSVLSPGNPNNIVTDNIPSGLAIDKTSLKVHTGGLSGPEVTMPAGALRVLGQKVTWDLTSLAGGEYTLEATVTAAKQRDVYDNKATIEYGGYPKRDTGHTYHRWADGPVKNAYINGSATAQNGTDEHPIEVKNGDNIKYTVDVHNPGLGVAGGAIQYDVVFALDWSSSMEASMGNGLTGITFTRQLLKDMSKHVIDHFPGSRVAVMGMNCLRTSSGFYNNYDDPQYVYLQYDTNFASTSAEYLSIIDAAFADNPKYDQDDNSQFLAAAIDKLAGITTTAYGSAIPGLSTEQQHVKARTDTSRIPVIVQISDFEMTEDDSWNESGRPYWSVNMKREATRFTDPTLFPNGSILIPLRIDHKGQTPGEWGDIFSTPEYDQLMQENVVDVGNAAWGFGKWEFASIVYNTAYDEALEGFKDLFDVLVFSTGADTIITDRVPEGLTVDVSSISHGGVYNSLTRIITWDLTGKDEGDYRLSYTAVVTEAKALYENWAVARRPDVNLESNHTYHQNVSSPQKNAYLETSTPGVFETTPKNGVSFDAPQPTDNGQKIKYEITATKPKNEAEESVVKYDVVFALDWSESMRQSMGNGMTGITFAKDMLMDMSKHVIDSYPGSRVAVMGMSSSAANCANNPGTVYLQYDTEFVSTTAGYTSIIQSAFNEDPWWNYDDNAQFLQAAIDKLAGDATKTYGASVSGTTVGGTVVTGIPADKMHVKARTDTSRIPVIVHISDFEMTEGASTANNAGVPYWSKLMKDAATRFTDPALFPKGSILIPVRMDHQWNTTGNFPDRFSDPKYDALMQKNVVDVGNGAWGFGKWEFTAIAYNTAYKDALDNFKNLFGGSVTPSPVFRIVDNVPLGLTVDQSTITGGGVWDPVSRTITWDYLAGEPDGEKKVGFIASLDAPNITAENIAHIITGGGMADTNKTWHREKDELGAPEKNAYLHDGTDYETNPKNGVSLTNTQEVNGKQLIKYIITAKNTQAPAFVGPQPAVAPQPIGFENGSFEQPALGSSTYLQVQMNSVPGWNTRPVDPAATHTLRYYIEIQKVGGSTGFATSAPSGTQYAELNCEVEGFLYQTRPTVPKTNVYYEFYHSARNYGISPPTDVMDFYLGPPNAAVRISPPSPCADTWPNWGRYTGVYTVPDGQTQTEFGFKSVSASSGNIAAGNYLDNIRLFVQSYIKLTVTNNDADKWVNKDQVVTYTINAKNTGESDSSNTYVIDTIPVGMEFQPGTVKLNGTAIAQGTGVGQYQYNSVARQITVRIGNMKGTGSFSSDCQNEHNITFDVKATGAGLTDPYRCMYNQASATYADRDHEAESGTYSNVSPADLLRFPVIVTDRIPDGLEIVSIGQGGVYDPVTKTVTWNFAGASAAGDELPYDDVDLEAVVKVKKPGIYNNVALVDDGRPNIETNHTYHEWASGILHIRQIVISPDSKFNQPRVGYFRLNNGAGTSEKLLHLTSVSGKDGPAVPFTDYYLILGDDTVYRIYDFIPQYYAFDGYKATTDNGNHVTSTRVPPGTTANGSISIDYGTAGEWWVTVYITPKGTPEDYGWDYRTNDFGFLTAP